jgi:hypothetical protein
MKIANGTQNELLLAVLKDTRFVINCKKGEILGPRGKTIGSIDGGRYKKITLNIKINGQKKVRTVAIHRLIWMAKHGSIPNGLYVCHRNDDKTDNRLRNLYLGTPLKNSSDAAASGRYRVGANHPKIILTPKKIAYIYKARQQGKNYIEISKKVGVSKTRVWQILKGQNIPKFR